MKEKGSVLLIILIILAIIVLSLFGFLVYQKLQEKPQSTPTISQLSKQEPKTPISLMTDLSPYYIDPSTTATFSPELTSNGRYWLISYAKDGLYKYESGKTAKIPGSDDESNSWIETIKWNGDYWLFYSISPKEALLKSFDGTNFTDYTKSFNQSTECEIDKINPATIPLLSWNGKRWIILSSTHPAPKKTQYCVTAFDGSKFVDLTVFLRKSIDLNNYYIRSFDCNNSFCMFGLKSTDERNEYDFAFFKLNFEELSVEPVKYSNFTDYSAYATYSKYADIIGSNEKSLILTLSYNFTEAASNKLDASSTTEFYEYDGERAKLLYKYSYPYLPQVTPVADIFKAHTGLFIESPKAVWDPFRKRWFLIGITSVRGSNVENELTILEVDENYNTQKLKYSPSIVNKATGVESIAVTKEGILIEEPLTGIVLIKFPD